MTFCITLIHSFNMISISTNIFKADQIPCASLIWKLVPFGSIMFTLLKPSINFAVSNMVITLAFDNVKSRKYLLS